MVNPKFLKMFIDQRYCLDNKTKIEGGNYGFCGENNRNDIENVGLTFAADGS